MARSSRTELLLLLALMCIGLTHCAAAPTPCTNSPGTALWGTESVLFVANSSFSIFARYPDGSIYKDASVSITFRGLQEFFRPANTQCYESPTTFPLTQSEHSADPFGYVQTSDLMCEYEQIVWQADNGAVINTTKIKTTWPAHPDFLMTFNLSLPTKDATVSHYHSVSQGQTLFEHYEAGGYKIAFEIINWPWETSNTNHYVAAFWQVSATLPSQFTGAVDRIGNTTYLNISTLDGILKFTYDVDQSFLADDKILVRQLTDVFPYNNVTLPAGNYDFGYIGLSFCEINPTVGNWTTLYHDPTLSVLFSPPITPETPQQKRDHSLAIGLSIGLVALALIIVGVIVLLIWKVPKVKHFFQPFSARPKGNLAGQVS